MTQLLIDRATLEQALDALNDTTGLPSTGARSFDNRIMSIRALRAALANAEQPVIINDDAFWSSAMKSINPISVDAEGLALWLDSFPRRWPELDQAAALLRAQAATAPQPAPKGEPVCHGCGIPAGDVHMSTCKSGKWPSRVSNGDTAAPAPQAQPAIKQSFTVVEQSAELDAGMAAQHYCRGLWGAARGHADWRKVHEHFANGYKQGRYDELQVQGPAPQPAQESRHTIPR